MKKILFPLLLTICSFVSAAKIELADPTIFYHDGYYYLSGTLSDAGLMMYRSKDLVHWARTGNASGNLALNMNDAFGTKWFWAPQIFRYEDTFYMAYSANELIAIAKSDKVNGPYKIADHKELPHNTGQIDPFVFIDDDGTKYMYYVRFTGGNELWVCELTDDFHSIKDGTITKCLGPEKTWETYQAKVTEGPTMFKDGGYYYLIYSANDYQSKDYAVGYAYSKNPRGPWTKLNQPFISRHACGMNGTGHGDLFQDQDGNWNYVFHVHHSNTQVQIRYSCIVPITITDNPENKFIPQWDRLYVLDDAAASSARLPKAQTTFEVDGICYRTLANSYRNVEVIWRDPIYYGGYEGDIDIPSMVEYEGVTYNVRSIGPGAFYKCPKLGHVTLGAGIRTIDVGAFENSGIKSIEIPAEITYISYRAFADCGSLKDVICHKAIPISSLGTDAFPSNVLSTGKLWVPSSSVSKYQNSNAWKNFKNINTQETGNITYDFQTDDIYYSILSPEEGTCEVKSRTSTYNSYCGPDIVIPYRVSYDDKDYIVTKIGNRAFSDCRTIRSITFPEDLNCIGIYAFYGCNRLYQVTCLSQTPPKASGIVFQNSTFDGTLIVPTGTRDAYSEATNWRKFKNIIEQNFTSIHEIPVPKLVQTGIYNMLGQRLQSPQSGINIINGRKVLVP